MTQLELRAHEYADENRIEFVDNRGEYDSTYFDIRDSYIDGAEYMLNRVLTFMRNFKNGQGECPLYDYIGNVCKAMEE